MKRIIKKLKKLLRGVRTVAILCTQWGDSGKGKLIDLFAAWADLILRLTGGNNAGHTIVVNGKKYVVHLVPSSILWPGKINIIGSGVVLDPLALCQELEALSQAGVDYKGRLFIAQNAKLLLPQHIAMDMLKEAAAGKGKIGTTNRGIGPAYVDHYARIRIPVNDLLNPQVFAKNLERNLAEHNRALKAFGRKLVAKVMNHERLGNGKFYDAATNTFNGKAITKCCMQCAEKLAPMIADTDKMIRDALGKKNILFEGAQGNMLGIDSGTYPYVTSSDCTLAGMAKGAGVYPEDIECVVAIAKAFYITRVGEGPFPTEIFGELAEKIRENGGEYGATTGRPRRVGWFDVPVQRYSMHFCGYRTVLALTKLDVLSDQEVIKICTAYKYTGPDYRFGERLLKAGDLLDVAIPASEVMACCEPVYEEYPGWMCKIDHIKDWDKLPKRLLRIIKRIEKLARVKVVLNSVGADRKQTVFL
jgi:adenylosuccinate synthase